MKNQSRTITLIRHLKPKVAAKTLLGHTDVELDDHDSDTINQIQKNFKETSDCKIFTSDLKRSSQTSKLLFPHSTKIATNLLREINFGVFELYTWSKIEDQDPKFYELYMADWHNIAFPKGESMAMLLSRCNKFCDQWIYPHNTSQQYIVAHAGSIRSLIYILTDLTLNDCFEIDIGYGAIITITKENNSNWEIKL